MWKNAWHIGLPDAKVKYFLTRRDLSLPKQMLTLYGAGNAFHIMVNLAVTRAAIVARTSQFPASTKLNSHDRLSSIQDDI